MSIWLIDCTFQYDESTEENICLHLVLSASFSLLKRDETWNKAFGKLCVSMMLWELEEKCGAEERTSE